MLKQVNIFFLMMIGYGSVLSAETLTQAYEIEKGIVYYDIVGGGRLTKETNLTLNGTAKLRFRDWGMTQLAEEKGTILTTGALQSKQIIKSFEKQTKESLFTVDYENETIHERKNSISNSLKERETEGLEKKGEEIIAGLPCDIWEGQGIKKCIYKGVPLKLESEILGIYYRKIASDVQFDINVSKAQCVLPDYPLEDFALFTSTAKTKNESKPEYFTEVLVDVAQRVEQKVAENNNRLGITKKEKTEFLNQIGQNIYEHQKELLPQLLESMKKTRECLQTVQNPFDANTCMTNLNQMKEELGREEDDFIILWDDERKSTLLDKIEDELIYLQSRIPCVNRAKNITDLSTCMK